MQSFPLLSAHDSRITFQEAYTAMLYFSMRRVHLCPVSSGEHYAYYAAPTGHPCGVLLLLGALLGKDGLPDFTFDKGRGV